MEDIYPVEEDSWSQKNTLEEPEEAESEATRWLSDEEERRGKRKKKGGRGVDDVGVGRSSEAVAGIVYLSRVPPFMKPHKVKHLLSRYGTVGRVYLKPEGISLVNIICVYVYQLFEGSNFFTVTCLSLNIRL